MDQERNRQFMNEANQTIAKAERLNAASDKLARDRMTIATAAMQGLLSSPHLSMDEDVDTVEDIAETAVAFADALLEELNK